MTSWESDRWRGTRLFDRVVVVDWSANSAPKRGADSIWIACLARGESTWTLNVPTRAQATEVLRRVVSTADLRTLIAVDFSLGFPAGTASALGLDGLPWASMWAELSRRISDDVGNRNNRFEVAADLNRTMGAGPGPFWGCPPARRSEWLTSTKVEPRDLPTWRTTEQILREGGHRPFSCWQLLGAGAVGSQSLLGIARLRQLVGQLAADGHATHVWPFTTGIGPPAIEPGGIVIGEIWPSMVPVVADDQRVRDEAQVLSVGRKLTELDRSGRLGGLFTPLVPAGREDAVVTEEGWVLGAGTSVAMS